MTETGLVRLVSSWFRLLGTLSVGGSFGRSGAGSGDRKLDRSGFSEISTCWEIAWELDRKIVLVTDLVFVAWPSGYDRGIVAVINKTLNLSNENGRVIDKRGQIKNW